MAGRRWRFQGLGRMAPGCLISFFLLVGCESNRPALAAADTNPALPGSFSRSATAEREPVRLQRDENEEADSSVQNASFSQRQPDLAQVAVRVRAQVNGVAI